MARVHHKAAPQSARESRARAQKTKQVDRAPSLLSRVWTQCRNTLKPPRIMKHATKTRQPSQSQTRTVAFASGAIIIPPGPPPPVPARARTREPARLPASPPEIPRLPWQSPYRQEPTGASYLLGVIDMTFIVENLLGL